MTSAEEFSNFYPLNVVQDGGSISDSSSSKKSSGYSSRSSSGAKSKASKRSRTNSPNHGEDNGSMGDGASSRQRRKSNSSTTNAPAVPTSSESKRRDSIKYGLEELQRALPQFGTPEEEKVKFFCLPAE